MECWVVIYADVCREAAAEFDHAIKYENGGADEIRWAAHLRALADHVQKLEEAGVIPPPESDSNVPT